MTKCRFPPCLDCCTLDFTFRKLRNIVIKNCESSKILKIEFSIEQYCKDLSTLKNKIYWSKSSRNIANPHLDLASSVFIFQPQFVSHLRISSTPKLISLPLRVLKCSLFPESSIPQHRNFKLHFELQKAYLNRNHHSYIKAYPLVVYGLVYHAMQ